MMRGMLNATRRQFLAATTGAVSAGAVSASAAHHEKPKSVFHGVTIGAQSYSFRDRDVWAAIKSYHEIGISMCELWSGHLEMGPDGKRRDREDLRKWRETVDLAEVEKVGEGFRKAGVDLYALNYSFRDDFSDAEIERGFEMAKAIGAKVLTASSNVTTARRVDPIAKKHNIRVGMHNHSRIHHNEFATPADFETAMKGTSHIAINLDIGHFTAAGFDPVSYLDERHDDIVTLHVKDRRRDQGANVKFGDGDTPIREVLRVLANRKSKIPANIEYEYRLPDTMAEVRRCFEYCRAALLSRGV